MIHNFITHNINRNIKAYFGPYIALFGKSLNNALKVGIEFLIIYNAFINP